MIIPQKLKEGDEIRVITPARSLALPFISKEIQDIAKSRFKELGFNLTFGKNVMEINEFNSSSIKSRVDDLHEAFKDKSVKMIITVIGGYNSIEILPYLDYELIKSNPKILCGYSDITALENAIYAKTGLVTYSGPHYFDFGELEGFQYTLEYFKKCLMNNMPYEVLSSDKWSEDLWGLDQINRNFNKNSGLYIINEGKCEGIIVGSNLVTFHSLMGTPFKPSLKDSILFIEEDDAEDIYSFNRNLTSITLQKDFNGVKGIVIGRFGSGSKINSTMIEKIIKNNNLLKNIIVIGGLDFGHTTPRLTFPIGGKAKIEAKEGNIKIEIVEH